ncbi:hypothetical protein TSMEX_007685 [Taenia solium]|eukprot:TsM_001141800 transcript=TsM_001141800 gene=TsM_001141800
MKTAFMAPNGLCEFQTQPFELCDAIYSLVRRDGCHLGPYKQVSIWSTALDQAGLRSFLGLENYYKDSVKGFTKITSSLYELTEKLVKKNFKCENEPNAAPNELEQALCSAPFLASPNFEVSAPPFVLDMIAGGVLLQRV